MSEAATRSHDEGGPDPASAPENGDGYVDELRLAVADLHSATERSSTLISQIAARGDRLAGDLSAARKSFSVGTIFAEAVARARGSIEEIGEKTQCEWPRDESEKLEPGLADFMSHYTMQAELDVHENVTRVATGNTARTALAEANNSPSGEADGVLLVSITRSKPTAFRRYAFSVLAGYWKDGGVSEELSRDLGREISRSVDHEVPIQGAARRDRGTNAGPAAADMRRAGSGDCAGVGKSGPRAYAGERAAAVGTGEAGAVYEGPIEPVVARRVSAVEEALLGATSLGSGVLLCERGRGGRRDDSEVHRKPAMGRSWGELQNHRAKRALRRLSAVSLAGGFSRKQATSSRNQTHRLLAGGRLV